MLDANALVRFLVQDKPKQGAAASTLFGRAERREIVLHLEGLVVAETVYVLMRLYGRRRTEVANVLPSVVQNTGVVTAALHRFALFNVDFANAWLAARSAHKGQDVASIDRDFDKSKNIRRVEPK